MRESNCQCEQNCDALRRSLGFVFLERGPVAAARALLDAIGGPVVGMKGFFRMTDALHVCPMAALPDWALFSWNAENGEWEIFHDDFLPSDVRYFVSTQKIGELLLFEARGEEKPDGDVEGYVFPGTPTYTFAMEVFLPTEMVLQYVDQGMEISEISRKLRLHEDFIIDRLKNTIFNYQA